MVAAEESTWQLHWVVGQCQITCPNLVLVLCFPRGPTELRETAQDTFEFGGKHSNAGLWSDALGAVPYGSSQSQHLLVAESLLMTSYLHEIGFLSVAESKAIPVGDTGWARSEVLGTT